MDSFEKDKSILDGKGEPDEWITVENGEAVPIQKGQTKREAISEHFDKEPEDISTLLGQEYSGYKGQAAINKLMQEKQGHVKAAFHREDIGDVDLLWGNDDIGLKHILRQRKEQGIDAVKFLSTLTDTIENGAPQISKRGNIEILKDNQIAVVQLEFKGNRLNFIVTAYKTRKTSW